MAPAALTTPLFIASIPVPNLLNPFVRLVVIKLPVFFKPPTSEPTPLLILSKPLPIAFNKPPCLSIAAALALIPFNILLPAPTIIFLASPDLSNTNPPKNAKKAPSGPSKSIMSITN